MELRYFRDVDGREVDFVVVDGRRPTHLVECKWDGRRRPAWCVTRAGRGPSS